MDFKTLSLITAIVLAATTLTNVSQDNEFVQFKSTFGRNYSGSEEVMRMAIFNENVAKINAHNADSTQTYKMGINQFTDMTQTEFETKILMPKWYVDNVSVEQVEVQNVDWVSQGAVTGVKDQGRCGSCWAFAAVASAESFKWIQQGTTGSFSDQQVVDCNTFPQMGCMGGRMDWALNWLSNNGFCTEASYPYFSGETGSRGSCNQSSCDKDSFTISGQNSFSGSANLANALAVQPVSVAVDASNWSPYSSGIFSNCGTGLNHGVLLAGSTSSYQLIKNSWGGAWGESGYIRLAPGNTCGVQNDASVPR